MVALHNWEQQLFHIHLYKGGAFLLCVLLWALVPVKEDDDQETPGRQVTAGRATDAGSVSGPAHLPVP